MRSWADRYVGTPYAGSKGGLACWGLVHRVFHERVGIELPEYGEISHKDLVAIADKIGTDSAQPDVWRQVERTELREFDVAVMTGWLTGADGRKSRGVCHVGVMTSPAKLLHVDRPHDAVEVPLTHASIRHRLVGFFRHRGLDT